MAKRRKKKGKKKKGKKKKKRKRKEKEHERGTELNARSHDRRVPWQSVSRKQQSVFRRWSLPGAGAKSGASASLTPACCFGTSTVLRLCLCAGGRDAYFWFGCGFRKTLLVFV